MNESSANKYTHRNKKHRQAWAWTYCWNKQLGSLLTWWRQPPLSPPTAPCCSPVKGDTKVAKTSFSWSHTLADAAGSRFVVNVSQTVSCTLSTVSHLHLLMFSCICIVGYIIFSLFKLIHRLLTMMQKKSPWSSQSSILIILEGRWCEV